MKAKKILMLTALSFILNTVSYAQFNTIGRIDTAPINKKKSHPAEKITQQDSLDENIDKGREEDSLTVSNNLLQRYLSVSYPLKQIKVGSRFGMRVHPIYHKKMMHNGVDLQARYEDVFSMFPGRVTKLGFDKRSGYYVTVQTADYTISYCHLSKFYVRQGEFIEAGTPIALSGNTGDSTGPHLHLTTKKDGKAINPVILLDYVRYIKDGTL